MKSKVKSARGRRAKGAEGERQAARDIMAHCPSLEAERNARNGKATSDVLVRRRDGQQWRLLEVKRVESLDIGTKLMADYRAQAEKDQAIGILWRKNGGTWRLEAFAYPYGWATFSGDDVWRVLEEIVG